MDDMSRDFSNRLLHTERQTPEFRERYDKEVREMLEKKLTTPRKWAHIASGLMTLGLAVFFGRMAIIWPEELPGLARAGFILGAVFGLGWTGLSVWIVKRGSVDLSKHPSISAGMAWGFTITLLTLFMMLAPKLPNPIIGVQMVLNGLVFLVLAAVFMISNRIDQAELKTRRKLLEMECRLAEIAEKVTEEA